MTRINSKNKKKIYQRGKLSFPLSSPLTQFDILVRDAGNVGRESLVEKKIFSLPLFVCRDSWLVKKEKKEEEEKLWNLPRHFAARER